MFEIPFIDFENIGWKEDSTGLATAKHGNFESPNI